MFKRFRNARLVVVTQGQQGSIVRFEDRLIKIPAVSVKSPVDELGAGDTYMGTMLGQLFNQPYKLWNSNLIKHTARVATFAASLVVSSSTVRLGLEQTQSVLAYSETIKNED